MGIALSTATHRARTSDDPLFLTIGQVRARYGDVSVMWINRHIKQNGMPAGIRFGGKTSARHWSIAELEAWEAKRSAS
jgi:predicted DNA-binding transcriptional regulator AlpA